jgi:hypothetical protein
MGQSHQAEHGTGGAGVERGQRECEKIWAPPCGASTGGCVASRRPSREP